MLKRFQFSYKITATKNQQLKITNNDAPYYHLYSSFAFLLNLTASSSNGIHGFESVATLVPGLFTG